MDDIAEKFCSGFCKSQNATRMVCCEYSRNQGVYELTDTDCQFQSCQYFADCTLMAEAKKRAIEF